MNPVIHIRNHVRRNQIEYTVIATATVTAIAMAKWYKPYMMLGSAGLKFISDKGLAEEFVESLLKK